jgi:GT2 family glycosyltransferase
MANTPDEIKITVGIVSRNRPDHLKKALASVFMQGHRPLEVVVVDDASAPPLIPLTAPPGISLRWWRYENNLGYIVARNDMMRQARGDYFVSLDDDAYLTDRHDLKRAAAFLDAQKQAGVLAFRIISPLEAVAGVSGGNSRQPQPTFTFTGCGHMLRRDLLPKTGFYREIFFHQGEEIDLCYRIWDSGHQVFSFPAVTVIHDTTLVARDWHKIDRFSTRNGLLTIWLNHPWIILPFSIINLFAKKVFHHIRHQTLTHIFIPSIQGIFQAIKDLPFVYKDRRPVGFHTISTILKLNKNG